MKKKPERVGWWIEEESAPFLVALYKLAEALDRDNLRTEAMVVRTFAHLPNKWILGLIRELNHQYRQP